MTPQVNHLLVGLEKVEVVFGFEHTDAGKFEKWCDGTWECNGTQDW
jgi:hypothetical protein